MSARGENALEIDANAFASELLVLRDWLRNAIPRDVDFDDERAFAAIARQFKVSTTATQHRLLSLAM